MTDQADALEGRLGEAVRKGLGHLGRGTTIATADREIERLQQLGQAAVHFGSEAEVLAEWEAKLWHAQDDDIEARSREWRQILLYESNIQYLVYHRGLKRWLPRQGPAWRVRSAYNIIKKAINLRTARLTENKPSVTVQADLAARQNVERAEYKETLFWDLWNRLRIHEKITSARRWACRTGSGFLEVGWDPDLGPLEPVTQKRARMVPRQVPATDPMTGQPIQDPFGGPLMVPATDPATGEPILDFDGIEEFYVDRNGQDLGPVERIEPDPDEPGATRRVRVPLPEQAHLVHRGEAFVRVRTPFNVRWDRLTDDLEKTWYLQDAEILSGQEVLSMFPDQFEELLKARPATDDDELVQWEGLNDTLDTYEYGTYYGRRRGRSGETGQDSVDQTLDQTYLVRRTFIWPRSRYLRSVWGEQGALLITVGGRLVFRGSLPKWAQQKMPFIQVGEAEEPGNHYRASPMRDLLPIQDDINRARSAWAEDVALRSRLLLWATRSSDVKFRLLGGVPGTLVETKSRDHKPEVLNLGDGSAAIERFYEGSLAAAADLGNMNEASSGKLPSAGLAAKAIFALQFADERSIQEVSNLQDVALQRLAEALDAVTRVEYTEARKVRVIGRDRSYIIEAEINPEDLDFDVEYTFLPGSMLTRQKEAVRNELLALMEAGLVDPVTVRRFLPSGVPDAYRGSYDLQEARARRILERLRRNPDDATTPMPYDDAAVHEAIFREFLLGQAYDQESERVQMRLLQYWQGLRVLMQPVTPQPRATAATPTRTGSAAASTPVGAGTDPAAAVPAGVDDLEALATAAQAPPDPTQAGQLT